MMLAMSLANLITITRGLLIAPILVLLFHGHRTAALVLFVVASAGDILDGMVARARDEITTWGKALDPAVDKALYVSLLASMLVLGDIPWFALALFLTPQIGLGLGALFLRVKHSHVQGARILGKGASALSFLGIVFLLAGWPYGLEILYAAIAASFVATLDYARTAFQATSS